MMRKEVIQMNNLDLTFNDLVEKLILLDEISELPGVNTKRRELIDLLWELFPQESVEIGLVRGTVR
jgi:hypothetical protein